MKDLKTIISEATTQREAHFHRLASFSDACEREHPETGFWAAYKLDLERIIHSKALRRYSDKTQVVYLVANDHITHRGYHVQCVSSFSRGLASLLGLNSDLVEAIALGHDVGHPPFGHEGEGYLSEICKHAGLGAFSHSRQSCRLFQEIEPLNLSLQTYDGFLCHDGGMKKRVQTPAFDKAFSAHYSEMNLRKEDPECDLEPKTLEGLLVKMTDSVSYIAKDLADACSLQIIKRDEIPKTCLGTTNEEILMRAGADLVQNSYNTDSIGFSEEVFDALQTLRAFNFERIYVWPPLKTESKKIRQAFWHLFELLLDDYERNASQSYLWKHFLHSKESAYKEKRPVEHVVDYIAGMTDRYFIRLLEKLIVPKNITVFDESICSKSPCN